MAVSNKEIAALESQLAEVASRKRQTQSEIVDLRKTLDELRETDVSKAVEVAGKLSAAILGRETVVKTLSDLETGYRSQLEAAVKEETEKRRAALLSEINSHFDGLRREVMAVHKSAKNERLAAAIAELGEVSGSFGNLKATNALHEVVSGLEMLLLPAYFQNQSGDWVKRS